MPYRHKIFDAISDNTSMRIFRTVASKDKNVDGIESKEIMREANVDPKLYYPRVSKLLKTELIKKQDGKYFLTSLGGEIYSGVRILDEALSIFWKLKAVDALMSSCNSTEDELRCIVDCLIDNDEIKAILKKDYHHFLPYHIINQKICKIGYRAEIIK